MAFGFKIVLAKIRLECMYVYILAMGFIVLSMLLPVDKRGCITST